MFPMVLRHIATPVSDASLGLCVLESDAEGGGDTRLAFNCLKVKGRNGLYWARPVIL
jgi:hypothetical protein